MAELELTPEVIKEETSAVTEQVQTQLAEVEAAAAAVAEAPLIDLEPEQKKQLIRWQSSQLMSRDRSARSQRRSISLTATLCSAMAQALSAKSLTLLTELLTVSGARTWERPDRYSLPCL